MSDHSIQIVPIKLEPHPHADTLSIVHIDGFTCVVKTEVFQSLDRAAYVIPDSVIPKELAEKCSGGKTRIRAVKIRQIISHGLLVPCEGEIGDDVTEKLGVTHYEPPSLIDHEDRPRIKVGKNGPSPKCNSPCYTDVENYRRNTRHLTIGEPVVATEKIHGANARYIYHDGVFYVGSRTRWKDVSHDCTWTQAAIKHGLEQKLAKYPGYTFFGEVYGQVQDLKYGHVKDGSVADKQSFACFDIFNGTTYVDYAEFLRICKELDLPMVPIIYEGPWTLDIVAMSKGNTLIGGDNIREGVVVKPQVERWERRLGRVILKVISDDYLTRKD